MHFRNLIAIQKVLGLSKETKIVNYLPQDSIASLFAHYFSLNGNEIERCYAGPKTCQFCVSAMVEICADATINELKTTVDIEQIVVILRSCTSLSNSQAQNAFSRLMNANTSAMKIKKVNENTGMDKIHNVLVDYLSEKQATFNANELVAKTNFFKVMSDIIWLIDWHTDKFAKLPHCPELPREFFIKKYRVVSHNGDLKKKPPKIKAEQLYTLALSLDRLIGQKIFQRNGSWINVKRDLQALADCITFYIDYLRPLYSSI